MSIITKADLNETITKLGRVVSIYDLIQVASEHGYDCKKCGVLHDVKPKVCAAPVTGGKCPSNEFKKHVEKDFLQDQRFIEVELVDDAGDAPETDAQHIILDLRDELATGKLDFTFNDVVQFTGVVQPAETNAPKILKDQEVFFLYVEVSDLKKKNETFVKKQINVNDEEREEIKDYIITHRDTIEKELTDSFAPHIYGMANIKLFLCKQIVGAKIKNSKIPRSDIHGLLIGPPGTAKSELLEEAAFVGQGVYQDCGNLTKAGIVAGMVEDKRVGGWKWEAGVALMTANLHALDEIDKTKHEGVYDELTMVLNKAKYTLRRIRKKDFLCPGPYAFGANPKGMQYDFNLPVKKNLSDQVSEAILNRIDGIFITDDTYNEETTKQILKIQRNLTRGTVNAPIPRDRLMQMLVVMREHDDIEFTDEAFEILDTYFHTLKKNSYSNTTGLMITTRQYQGLCRIAISQAKIKLKAKVEASDAKAAVAQYQEWYGKIIGNDIGNTSGTSGQEFNAKKALIAHMKENGGKGISFSQGQLLDFLTSHDLNETQANDIILALAKDGDIAKGRELTPHWGLV